MSEEADKADDKLKYSTEPDSEYVKLIRTCIDQARAEFREKYEQHLKLKLRLNQLGYAIKGLSQQFSIEVPEEEIARMNEYHRTVIRRKWNRKNKGATT